MIKYSSRSEKGLVRENNETQLLSIEIGEYLVLAADGLGGVQGGEIASKIAIQTISSELKLVVLHDNSSNEEIERVIA